MLSGINDLDQYWQCLQEVVVPIVAVQPPLLSQKSIELNIARFDVIDAELSGNKGFKLLPYLLDAKNKGYKQLLSFGGIHSNHLHALAFAAKRFGFSVVAIVRGYSAQRSPTLDDLQALNVDIVWQGRELYRQRDNLDYLSQIIEEYPDAYIIPEGGKGLLGWQGGSLMADILCNSVTAMPTQLAVAAGTGTTFLGLLLNERCHNIDISAYTALNNADELQQLASTNTPHQRWCVRAEYDFGGFAKMNKVLAEFIHSFERDYRIPLDPIYTAKLMYGVLADIEKNYSRSPSSIMLLHTGGLQGRRAMASTLHRLTHNNELKVGL